MALSGVENGKISPQGRNSHCFILFGLLSCVRNDNTLISALSAISRVLCVRNDNIFNQASPFVLGIPIECYCKNGNLEL